MVATGATGALAVEIARVLTDSKPNTPAAARMSSKVGQKIRFCFFDMWFLLS
jgi:hypothetical protein